MRKDLKDNIHFNRSKSLSVNAIIYFWISGRGPGKSTQAKELIIQDYFKSEKDKRKVSIWVLRNENIMKEQKFINSFLGHFSEYDLTATRGGVFEILRDGEGNKKINPQNGLYSADLSKPVIYFASISTWVNQLKSLDIDNIKWCIIDEFIPNLRLPNQRYQKGEAESLLSVYSTLSRNNNYETKFILIGNPYQLQNPYFRTFGINIREVRDNKDKIYIPFKDKAVVYAGKRYDLVVIDYFSVHPELKTKISLTPYGALLSLNEDFRAVELDGDEYKYIPPKIMKYNPKAFLYAKILISGRAIFCYGEPSNSNFNSVGFHFTEIDNGERSLLYMALDIDDLGNKGAIIPDKTNPLQIKLKAIQNAIKNNAYSVENENINDLILDLLTY